MESVSLALINKWYQGKLVFRCGMKNHFGGEIVAAEDDIRFYPEPKS